MREESTNSASASSRFSGNEVVTTSELVSNVRSTNILVTEDKIRLALLTHQSQLAVKGGWIAPFGIMITVITVFVSASFKRALGLSAEIWETVFAIIAIASLFWLALALFRRAKLGRQDPIEKILDAVSNRAD